MSRTSSGDFGEKLLEIDHLCARSHLSIRYKPTAGPSEPSKSNLPRMSAKGACAFWICLFGNLHWKHQAGSCAASEQLRQRITCRSLQFNVTVDNNQFRFLRNDGALLQVDIPPGLYSFDELNRTLKNLLLFDYNITNYALAPIQSSQRVSEVFIVTPNPSIIRTYWPLGTLQNLLGFDVTRVTSNPVGTSGQYFGDRTARFNQIDFYIIQTSLLSRGIRLNNKYAGVIAQVPIDNVPGSLINYAPQNIQWTAAPELGNGSTANNVTTILTDSNGNPVDTQGESYSVAIQVKYKVPLY